MSIVSRILTRTRPNDGIPPRAARPAPYRAPGQYATSDQFIPLQDLPPENPFLLKAFPYAVDEYGGFRRRPSCLILGASRTEHEHLRRLAAAADAIAFEAAVAENTLILHPDDSGAAAYLDLLHAAMPVVCDRPALPLAVTR